MDSEGDFGDDDLETSGRSDCIKRVEEVSGWKQPESAVSDSVTIGSREIWFGRAEERFSSVVCVLGRE